MMEVYDGFELCFPQLNTSCKKPTISWLTAAFLQFLLSFNCVLTVTLNLLVIISISHFRQGNNIYPVCVMMLLLAGKKCKICSCFYLLKFDVRSVCSLLNYLSFFFCLLFCFIPQAAPQNHKLSAPVSGHLGFHGRTCFFSR